MDRDSPAAQAGMRPGDIITAIGSSPVNYARTILRTIMLRSAGTPVDMSVWRAGQTDIVVARGRTCSSLKALRSQVLAKQAAVADAEAEGMHLLDITPALSKRFGLSETLAVVVDHVVDGTEADTLGLKAGDIILMIGNTPATKAKQAHRAFKCQARLSRSLAGTVTEQNPLGHHISRSRSGCLICARRSRPPIHRRPMPPPAEVAVEQQLYAVVIVGGSLCAQMSGGRARRDAREASAGLLAALPYRRRRGQIEQRRMRTTRRHQAYLALSPSITGFIGHQNGKGEAGSSSSDAAHAIFLYTTDYHLRAIAAPALLS